MRKPLIIAAALIAGPALAQTSPIDETARGKLAVTIYNQNLALVQDTRHREEGVLGEQLLAADDDDEEAERVREVGDGLADSVRGRMSRNGGTVRLRTAPGEGTEVHLRLPTTAAVEKAAERAPEPEEQTA